MTRGVGSFEILTVTRRQICMTQTPLLVSILVHCESSSQYCFPYALRPWVGAVWWPKGPWLPRACLDNTHPPLPRLPPPQSQPTRGPSPRFFSEEGKRAARKMLSKTHDPLLPRHKGSFPTVFSPTPTRIIITSPHSIYHHVLLSSEAAPPSMPARCRAVAAARLWNSCGRKAGKLAGCAAYWRHMPESEAIQGLGLSGWLRSLKENTCEVPKSAGKLAGCACR